MFKALSLAAALAVLPLSSASADPQTPVDPEAAAEASLEAASARFEARMEHFGERAEAIGDDDSLTEQQKGLRIAALWAEYAPDVEAFTAEVSDHAITIADEALANVDLDAIITEALTAVEESGALAMAGGIASNGAWASNDPEHMETYGLMAQYAVGEAMDAVDEIEVDGVTVDLADLAVPLEPVAPVAPAPPAAEE